MENNQYQTLDYDHEKALEAADEVIDLAREYDGVDAKDVANGLRHAMRTYVCSQRNLFGTITEDYNIEGGSNQELIEDGALVAKNSIDAVDSVLGEGFTEEDEVIIKAREHLQPGTN